MKILNSFTKWLYNRYVLVVRDEDTLEQKRTFKISVIKLLTMTFSFFVFSSVITYLLIFNVFDTWLDPKHEKMVLQKKLITLQYEMDSISSTLDKSIKSIQHLKLVFNGTDIDSLQHEQMYGNIAENELNKSTNYQLKKTKFETKFNNQISKDGLSKVSNGNYRNINSQEMSSLELVKSFITPISFAKISGVYEPEKKHYGIDLVAKEGQPVMAISRGIVVLSEYLYDGGETVIIQHSNGFISIYQHNQWREVEKGQKVETGEVIAMLGNSGQMTSGPHLHFELWQYGHPLDPQKILLFD